MSIWGKPNIEKLIQKKDAKGLNKALETDDYRTIKAAIIGLIKLNEWIFDSDKVLILINDPDPETRKIPYTYGPFGPSGLFANVTAVHDPLTKFRIEGLKVLSLFHLPNCLEVLSRSAIYDPDEDVRFIARSYYDKFVSDHPESLQKDVEGLTSMGFDWFSHITLFEEFIYLINQKYNKYLSLTHFNPTHKQFVPTFPFYQSPNMNALRYLFREALTNFPHDQNRSIACLKKAGTLANEIWNWQCANEPMRHLLDSEGPALDFRVCSIIMLAKTNSLF